MRRTTTAICLVGVLALTACSGAETSRSHPSAAAGDTDDLTYAEIMERCLPQLQRDWKKTFLARPTASNLVLRNPRLTHGPGDLIGIGYRGPQSALDGGLGRAYCLIPRAGHERDQVPASRLRPDPTDTRQVDELCTEASGENGAGGGDLTGYGDIANIDLSRQDETTVLATASLGDRVMVLYGGGNISSAALTCRLDESENQIHAVASEDHIDYTDELSDSDGSRVLYYGAGLTTPRARTIEISPPGGRVYRVPVRRVSVATSDIPDTPFGAYAFFLALDYPRSYYGTFPARVLDADGTVLSTSQWDSAAMDRLEGYEGPR